MLELFYLFQTVITIKKKQLVSLNKSLKLGYNVCMWFKELNYDATKEISVEIQSKHLMVSLLIRHLHREH